MSKAELINRLADELGSTIPKTAITVVIDEMVTVITKELVAGGEVSIVGFGTFAARWRKGRPGHNPKTGEKLEVPTLRVPKFKAGSRLKEAVKGAVVPST